MKTFSFRRDSLVYSLILLFSSAFFLGAQNNPSPSSMQCKVGMEYQRFICSSKGTNRPIVLTVEPNSPAAIAGIKVGDFIETINGKKTSSLSENEIQTIFSSATASSEGILLEVSNFGYKRARRTIYPLCYSRSYMDESTLVDAFAFYSLEDASSRKIVYPFTSAGDSETAYEDLLYFTFSPSATDVNGSDNGAIVKILSKALQQKGLVYDDTKSQIVVDYYYSIAHNPYYKEDQVKSKTPSTTLRYDFDKKALVPYPLLSIGEERQTAPFILTFGITLFDGKQANQVIWNSEAVEFLTDELSIADYVAMAAPAMLMQFPLVRYNSNMKLRVVDKNYYYTGILYDSNDMSRVAQVIKNSPADQAGIQAGDYIIAINAKPMASPNELTRAYRSFVKESIFYRDESTIYTDSKGVKGCRYWNLKDYKKIRQLFEKKKYKTIFAYLFGFSPYISGEDLSGQIFFDINRGGMPHTIAVTPQLRHCSFVSLD